MSSPEMLSAQQARRLALAGQGLLGPRPDGGPKGVLRRLRAVPGHVLLFSSGHFLRVFAARWLGLEPAGGRYFLLSTASLSALGYEHTLSQPVICLWDDTQHVDSRLPNSAHPHLATAGSG